MKSNKKRIFNWSKDFSRCNIRVLFKVSVPGLGFQVTGFRLQVSGSGVSDYWGELLILVDGFG